MSVPGGVLHALVGAICVSVAGAAIAADNPQQPVAVKLPAGANAGAKPPPPKSARRLPRNYGKLNLSDAQRFKIYDIQGVFNIQIDELEEQISQLKVQRDGQVRAVLTLDQQHKLAALASGGQAAPINAVNAPTQPAGAQIDAPAVAVGNFVRGAVAGGTAAGL